MWTVCLSLALHLSLSRRVRSWAKLYDLFLFSLRVCHKRMINKIITSKLRKEPQKNIQINEIHKTRRIGFFSFLVLSINAWREITFTYMIERDYTERQTNLANYMNPFLCRKLYAKYLSLTLSLSLYLYLYVYSYLPLQEKKLEKLWDSVRFIPWVLPSKLEENSQNNTQINRIHKTLGIW